jgi:putative methionine-R-sulfoxide reductase with GAF domain
MLWLAGHLKGASPSWRHLVEGEREAVLPEPGGPAAGEKAEPDEAAAASEPRSAAGEAGLHAATGPAKAGEPGGEPFPAPTLPALPGRAELYRALWPLKRRVDSRVRTTTDVRATADFIAETGIPCPVLRPEKERWLDAVLVVEESPSMAVWRRTVRELHQVLVRSGIFRDVRIWRFARSDDGRGMRLHEGFSGPMPADPGRHPSALAHPDGRRLILMVSDAVSRAWHEGVVYGMARHWEKGAVTALVQMMPYWLWERTGLDRAISARLVAAGPGDANHRLQIAVPRRVLRTLTSKTKKEGLRTTDPKRLHLPVVMLSPDFLGPLADSISGRRYHRLPGVVYDEARFPAASPPIKGDAESGKPDPDPEKLVDGFRSTASHPARRLASFLAAAPLTLPIMRAVQGKMLPDSRQYHLAEVMLSGMVLRKSPRETWLPSDEIWYEFFPGVREWLLAESRRDETLDVLTLVCDELSAFVDENTGRRESFRAVLAGGGGAGEGGLKIGHEPFARVAAFVLKRLGGRYAKFALLIERSGENGRSLPERALTGVNRSSIGRIEKSHIEKIKMLITSSANIQDVFERILETAYTLMREPDTCKIYLYDPVTETLNLKAIHRKMDNGRDSDDLLKDYKLGSRMDISNYAIATRKTFVDLDVAREKNFYRPHKGTGSEIAVPISEWEGDNVEGVLSIQSNMTYAFSKHDTDLAEKLGDLISMAIYSKRKKRYEDQVFEKFAYLVQKNILTRKQLRSAISKAKEQKISVETYLIEVLKAPKEGVLESLSVYYKVDSVTFQPDWPIPIELIGKVTESLMREGMWVPLTVEGGKIIVAISDPNDQIKTRLIRKVYQEASIEFKIAVPKDILNFIIHFKSVGPIRRGSTVEKYNLRKKAIIVSDKNFKEVFLLNNGWQPMAYVQNDYKDNGDGTVTDWATGLTWEKFGSANKMSLEYVEAYIRKLNNDVFAGYTDWRLPTVDELNSLLEPETKNDDLFVDPIFSKEQRWCWTSDQRASEGVPWYVDFTIGRINPNFLVRDGYVRAVRP